MESLFSPSRGEFPSRKLQYVLQWNKYAILFIAVTFSTAFHIKVPFGGDDFVFARSRVVNEGTEFKDSIK